MKLQKIWDQLLLEGWRNDEKLRIVTAKFFEKAEITADPDAYPIDVLCELDLKRIPEKPFEFGTPAKIFISRHCQRLNLCLMDKRHSNEDVLRVIEGFDWRGLAHKKPARRDPVRMKVRARELDKKHDWKTVS